MAEGVTLPVVFTTQTPYPIPAQKFMIPATWKRYQLSQLINKALSLPKPVPFDFLIQGEVLRVSLAEWCSEKDFGFFVTGSYDGGIRVFNSSQKLTQAISGHTAPITSVCILPSRQTGDADIDTETRIIASTSHDLTARLTSLSFSLSSHEDTSPLSTPKALASLHLHTAPLSSVHASPSGDHILTASWDKLIGLWDTTIPSHDEVPLEHEERKKRRKVAAGEEGGNDVETPKRKAPVSVLKSHTGRVMKAIFEQRGGGKAYSCALDSTVRVWDVESGVCVETISASEKPFIDLISSTDGSTLLAASTDRSITAYDPRLFSSSPSSTSSSTQPTIATLTQHSTPSSLSPSPSNVHQFVSGGYDGVVRLWDVRSLKGAVASFRYTGDANVSVEGKGKGKGGKVLALDWARGIVGVGGENGLDVWKIGEGGNVE